MTLKSRSTEKSYLITVTRVNVIRYFPPLYDFNWAKAFT